MIYLKGNNKEKLIPGIQNYLIYVIFKPIYQKGISIKDNTQHALLI